jgi:hypothetical protein
MRIDVSDFLGANTQLPAIKLPDGVGSSSLNQKPGRGDMRPWRQPLQVSTVPASPQRKTIHRMGRSTASDTSNWLSWTSVVHAIRGFDREDTQERTYFTGAAGGPAWTDNTQAIASAPYPTSSRPLGVPAPVNAPLLSVATAGTSTTTEDRYYVTTFVNDIGWESAPSPPVMITCKTDALVKLDSLEAAPAGNYGINRRRIYRTQSGTSGATEFFYVNGQGASGITYTGGGQSWTETVPTVSDEVLKTQTVLGGWAPCPLDATCLTQMWGGMAAVISGKTIRPCVANTIYAYPLDYEIPIADQPIALGVWGQNLLVLTNGTTPTLIGGSDPASLMDSPLDALPFNGAARSVQSVISLGHGVAWAAPDGMAYIGSYGQKILTAGLIHPDTWRAMHPETMVSATYLGLLFVFYDDASGARKGMVIDPGNPTGAYFLSKGYQAAYTDPLTGSMFMLDSDGGIKKWDAGAAFMTATFRSKETRTPSVNLGFARVIADAYPVTLRLLAHGITMDTTTIVDDTVHSLAGGYEANAWQIEVESASDAGVVSAHVAQADSELLP